MVMKFIAAALLFAVSAAPAQAANPQFQTPSGNIGCEYQADSDDRLYCVRLEPEMRYIEFYEKGAYSGAYEGDSWFPSDAPVLKYGENLVLGPYTCTSQESGLVCARGEHGFEANRKGITTY